MIKLLEYGERLEFNKDRIIVFLIVVLFTLLVGGSYGVYLGDFSWKFSLILPAIVSLALSINLLTNIDGSHLHAPAGIIVFFVFNFAYDMRFLLVGGWLLSAYLGAIVGALVDGIIKHLVKSDS